LFEKSWHALSNDEIFTLLKVNVDTGLDSEDVSSRQKRDGLNKISKKRQVSEIERFASFQIDRYLWNKYMLIKKGKFQLRLLYDKFT
jgi:hypothetical protein